MAPEQPSNSISLPQIKQGQFVYNERDGGVYFGNRNVWRRVFTFNDIVDFRTEDQIIDLIMERLPDLSDYRTEREIRDLIAMLIGPFKTETEINTLADERARARYTDAEKTKLATYPDVYSEPAASTVDWSAVFPAPSLAAVESQVWPIGDPVDLQLMVESVMLTTFSVQAGAFPDGVELNTATGEITGSPTDVENGSVTVRVTDAAGHDDAVINYNTGAVPTISSISDRTGGIGETGQSINFTVTGSPFPSVSVSPVGTVFGMGTVSLSQSGTDRTAWTFRFTNFPNPSRSQLFTITAMNSLDTVTETFRIIS